MDTVRDLSPGGRLTVRGAEDGLATNADVELVDEQGDRWSATVLTLAEIGRLMESYRSSGECQSGAYFRVPDLVIVRDPNLAAVLDAFAELHRTGEYRYEMTQLID